MIEILLGAWGFASPFIYVFLIQQHREKNSIGVFVPSQSKIKTFEDLKQDKIIV